MEIEEKKQKTESPTYLINTPQNSKQLKKKYSNSKTKNIFNFLVGV